MASVQPFQATRRRVFDHQQAHVLELLQRCHARCLWYVHSSGDRYSSGKKDSLALSGQAP
ncbi:MAG: hypothetical protein ABGY24_08235, partial [bacterium]